MKRTKYICLILLATFLFGCEFNPESSEESKKCIHNGVPWFDNEGNIVNAHGACIVEEEGRFYLFGERRVDGNNAFAGFNCYSSDNLMDWTFENTVLPVQESGLLGPNRVGERVKVMKCPSTGEFVMYMHTDNLEYRNPRVGYATCKTINGDYEFHGALLHEGKPITRWDIGTFQDTDGTGYLLIHHGSIYRLSEDYCSAEAKVLERLHGAGESPAMFKKNNLYYMLFSGITSWERNDNFYFTAPAIEGPWTKQGLFAPKGTMTYNSQTTFVFQTRQGDDTIPIFMGDRWSYPHQASAATYVWMPLQVDGEKLSIPEYWEAWNLKTIKKIDPLEGGKRIPNDKFVFNNEQKWKREPDQIACNVKNSWVEVPFTGTRVAIVGETNPYGAYARVKILNEQGEKVHDSLVDFYSKVSEQSTRFVSPRLPKDNYTLLVEVTGIISECFKKDGTRYGSNDRYITINDFLCFSD